MRRLTFAAVAIAVLMILGAPSMAQAGQGHGHTPVTICHKGDTITVDDSAVQKHLDKHGDTLGECPPEPTQTPTPEPEPSVTPSPEVTPPVTEPHETTPPKTNIGTPVSPDVTKTSHGDHVAKTSHREKELAETGPKDPWIITALIAAGAAAITLGLLLFRRRPAPVKPPTVGPTGGAGNSGAQGE